MSGTLYKQDFYLWTREQARALRARAEQGANLPVDWENVAEEIEDLGTARRSELRRRLRAVMEHLLKLEHSPAAEPRAGWKDTIARERVEIEDLLKENPSLRPDLPSMAEAAMVGAVRLTARSLIRHGEHAAAQRVAQAGTPYTLDQLLGDDWYPPEPE